MQPCLKPKSARNQFLPERHLSASTWMIYTVQNSHLSNIFPHQNCNSPSRPQLILYSKSGAFDETNKPIMRPKSPNTELKISMTKILTNLSWVSVLKQALSTCDTYKLGSAASARAAPLPLMPTETPHIKLHIPTVIPDQNRAYPV